MIRPQSSPKDPIASAQEWLKRNRHWIALGMFVGAIVLQSVSAFVKAPALTAATGIAFLVVLVERLTRVGTDVGEVLELQKAERQPVYTLADAMNDLHDRLQHVRRTNRITIQHLGLDMTEAWKELKRALASCDAVTVECEVLIMTDDPAQLGPDAASDMIAWCKAVPGSIAVIAEETPGLAHFLAQRNTSLKLTLKKYTGTPRIHGIVITEPFERGYLSFASWVQKAQFEWGGDDYFCFENGTMSDADRRLRQLLRGAVDYHWNRATTATVFEYPPPVVAAPAVV